MVRGLPEEIHRDHGPGPKAKLARRRAGPLQAFGIEIEAHLLHVREHRRRANESDHLGAESDHTLYDVREDR